MKKVDWLEVLTWKTEYTIEEQKQNLIDVIKFGKRLEPYHPYLKQNIIQWECELKNLILK